MLQNTEDKVLLKTAIGHSKFRLFYGLNYCPLCVQVDIEKFGFSYWHIIHQIPGIQVCHLHSCLLNSIPLGDGNRDRTLFLPPNTAPEPALATEAQISFTRFANELLALSQFEKMDYKSCYQHLLINKGLQNPVSGHLKMAMIVSQLKGYWHKLAFSDHLEAGVPECLSGFEFLGSMLRTKTHSYCHPIKHLLLACWLTEGCAQKLLVDKSKKSRVSRQKRQVDNTCEKQILELLQSGLSLNKIHKITGRSRCYIRRVAELNRIAHQTNSSAYPKSIRRAVLIKALYGRSRDDIAKECNVGLGYVEQTISNEPNMVAWRKHLKTRKKVLQAFLKLKALSRKYPDWPRTRIRSLAETEYLYLYKHAKALIEQIMPRPQKPKAYAKDWNAEDTRIYYALLSIDNIDSMSVSEIDRRVNGHGNLLRNRTKLPLTAQLLLSKGK